MSTGYIYTVPVALAMIMFGCCSNVVTMELLLNIDSRSGSLITICQFLFVTVTSIDGVITYEKDSKLPKLRPLTTPFWFHCLIVIVFFSQSIINNVAFGYDISMVLHSIFRSGSLIMNLIVGLLFFGTKIPFNKMLCVLAITIGIALATYGSSQSVKLNSETVFNKQVNYSNWMFGISLLTISQVMSGFLGNMQEYAYRKYGKDWRENLFYSHALSLPLFLILSQNLTNSIRLYNAQPVAWLYLVANILTQFLCIRGVYMLTALSGTLTTTLAITVRKFVSLIISIIWFGNYFGTYHWIATALVFGAGFVYTIIQSEKPAEKPKDKTD